MSCDLLGLHFQLRITNFGGTLTFFIPKGGHLFLVIFIFIFVYIFTIQPLFIS